MKEASIWLGPLEKRLFLFTLVMWMTGITNHALDSSNHDTKFGNSVDGLFFPRGIFSSPFHYAVTFVNESGKKKRGGGVSKSVSMV